MADKLKIEFPTQGWKQFLTSRKAMLDAYDRAREKARSHEVETFHGRLAEAEFRKWLSSFLPKRYGVTSGFIVSPGLKSNEKTPHFDVIIYDQLEAPVLWVDDSPDISSQGQSLAIPVEYVHCVLEVKAAFSKRTVQEAMEHLKDLLPLMGGQDGPQDKYKLHLPMRFACGLVFFEMRKTQEFSMPALAKVCDGVQFRGFFGGIILRGEGHSTARTARLSLLKSKTPIKSDKKSLLDGCSMTSVRITDELHLGAMSYWNELNFSQFGFDLVAMMQGTYEVGRLSSFYCTGASEWEDNWP